MYILLCTVFIISITISPIEKSLFYATIYLTNPSFPCVNLVPPFPQVQPPIIPKRLINDHGCQLPRVSDGHPQ